MVLTSNCIAGPSGSIGLFHQLSNYSNLGDQRLPFVPPLPRQFFTSNSLAAHLGGGRCGQGGVPVTEGPKVLSFQGFGEGNSKVLDTVTGETLTALPVAIPSPPRNCWNSHQPVPLLPTNSATEPNLRGLVHRPMDNRCRKCSAKC